MVSLSLSLSLSLYIYCSFFLHSVDHFFRHVILIFSFSLFPSLSHFFMIQRSSRGSNLVPRWNQKRLTRQFPHSYTHFTKKSARFSALRRVPSKRDGVLEKKNRRDVEMHRSAPPKTPIPRYRIGPVATRGPATRHSFRSGDRIGPRAVAATYIIILIMIIILEIGASHDDCVARPIAWIP